MDEIKREVAFAGQRVKQKVIFALALCSVIPLLVLTYTLHGYFIPGGNANIIAGRLQDLLALPILPNRALCMDRLSPGLTRTQRPQEHLAVLFLDLDRFKVVNDTLGHAVGDQLLVEVSNRLGSSLRPGDTVARLGGDEFGLLLEDVADGETAEAVALRIEAELAKPLHFEGREIFITASIGIALSSARLGMPEEILRDADLAMYHAKAKGKARHEIFDDSMSAPALDRMDLEMDLRSAISHHEFRL